MNISSAYIRIWEILTGTEHRNAIYILILMIIGMLLEMLGIGLVIPTIIMLTDPNFAANYPEARILLNIIGSTDYHVLVVTVLIGLVGVFLIKAIYLAFLLWKQNKFVMEVQAGTSQRLFTIYLLQPYTFHLQRNSAQLIRNTMIEVNLFAYKCVLPAISLITETLVLIGLALLLILVEPVGTIFIIVIISLASLIFQQLTRNPLLRWGEQRQHHDGRRIQRLQEGLGGVKDVILLGRESDFLERYSRDNSASARAGQLQMTFQQIPRLWLELLAVLSLVLLIFSMMAQGYNLKGIIPILGLFAAAAFRLMPSVNRILSSILTLRSGLPVINTIYNELEHEREYNYQQYNGVMPSESFQKIIEFDEVNYIYPEAHAPALRNLSLIIGKGETIGIIGTSGAGKTTLVDVLLGLLTPHIGQVKVDGVDIQKNLRNWQRQIGYVPQTIYISDDTLRNNIAFGLSEKQIDEHAVESAVRSAQLTDFIRTLPDGLNTVVGERGVRLSGGQRQRIGIARALYHNPAVLVMDEATSALDSATEKEVMLAVSALRGDKTIIIVAHRTTTVAICGKIYKLENGGIEREGSFNEVINK